MNHSQSAVFICEMHSSAIKIALLGSRTVVVILFLRLFIFLLAMRVLMNATCTSLGKTIPKGHLKSKFYEFLRLSKSTCILIVHPPLKKSTRLLWIYAYVRTSI